MSPELSDVSLGSNGTGDGISWGYDGGNLGIDEDAWLSA